MTALKITADRIAEVGECKYIMSIAFSHGSVPAKSAGTIAKYFATSLATENVVSASRVMRSCFPISTHFDQFGRIGVQIDHVASFFRRLSAGVHRQTDVGLGQRRRVISAVAHHRDQLSVGLLFTDVSQF